MEYDQKPKPIKTLLRLKERVGIKINYWELIEYKGCIKNRPVYLCRCVCGIERNLYFSGGKKPLSSKSCGCSSYLNPVKRPKGPVENLKKYSSRYSGYKSEARNRNYSFNLTYEEFCKYMEGNCFYCDSPPSNKCKYNYLDIVHSGIDRVDNTKGYSLDNCVSCCRRCNQVKKAIPPSMVYKIYNFLFKDIKDV